MQCIDYENNDDDDQQNKIEIIYERVPSSNITDIFYLDMIKDEDRKVDDYDDDDQQEQRQNKLTIKDIVKCKELLDIKDENIVKCHKRADSYFDKWCKLNKK